MSRVSGFWSLAGLIVIAIFGANLLAHPSETEASEKAATGLESTVGNQILGKS